MRIKRKSSKRKESEICSTKMWQRLMRSKRNRTVQYRPRRMSWRNCKTKSQAIKRKLESCTSWFELWKTTSISMVLRLPKPTLVTTVASSRLNWRTIWLPNFRRKTLKQRANWNNSKTCMRLCDPIEIFTQRIFLKHRKRSLSWEWSSEEWPRTFHSLRKRYLQRTLRSSMKKNAKKSRRVKTSNSLRIKQKLREISGVRRKWSKLRRVILPDWSMSSARLSLKNKSRRKTTKWSSTREIFSELNSSREMRSSHSSTKRSRSRKVPSTRERSTIKSALVILWISEKKLQTSRDNW